MPPRCGNVRLRLRLALHACAYCYFTDCDLNDVAVVIHLHELARVFGRPACGRNGRRLEWPTKI